MGSLRFVIYVNDHAPAHVHVLGDGEAKIALGIDNVAPHLLWAVDMTAANIRRAMRVTTEHKAMLLRQWEEIRGRTR